MRTAPDRRSLLHSGRDASADIISQVTEVTGGISRREPSGTCRHAGFAAPPSGAGSRNSLCLRKPRPALRRHNCLLSKLLRQFGSLHIGFVFSSCFRVWWAGGPACPGTFYWLPADAAPCQKRIPLWFYSSLCVSQLLSMKSSRRAALCGG